MTVTRKQQDAATKARARLAAAQDRGEVARDPRDRLVELYYWSRLDELPEPRIHQGPWKNRHVVFVP